MKKIVAEWDLEIEAMKELLSKKMVSFRQREAAVGDLIEIRDVIMNWRLDYNLNQPLSALN
ncbi:MAG TPA: hypothetical protein PLF50_06080 [Candidatus Cloacimonadota bacterium]|nr:hypothetical protein [Candidatus Cloacimonadota bacterium]